MFSGLLEIAELSINRLPNKLANRQTLYSPFYTMNQKQKQDSKEGLALWTSQRATYDYYCRVLFHSKISSAGIERLMTKIDGWPVLHKHSTWLEQRPSDSKFHLHMKLQLNPKKNKYKEWLKMKSKLNEWGELWYEPYNKLQNLSVCIYDCKEYNTKDYQISASQYWIK